MIRTISLNGVWKMRQADLDTWHESRVPGSVYSTMMADGSMPDPFYRENELEAFDLLKNDFEFVRTFDVDASLLACEKVLLRFEGLDTLAHVFLNGEEIAYASNMHICWEFDVKEKLLTGENTLMVHFDSPINAAIAAYDASPNNGSTDAIPGYPHIRKAHCMYGWDWGPRLPDAGIWRDVSLIGAGKAMFESVLVLQEHEAGKVTLKIRPELKYGCAKECTYDAVVTAPDGHQYTASASMTDGEAVIVIDDPKLWWPAGYGDQPLYTVNVTLKTTDAEDTWEKRIGLRTLTVSRKPDEWGEEFCHVVNGVKIFAMGGDYIPEDNILSRVTPDRTRHLLEDAKLAHFNTIRVWGGGYYPNDFFFDICDELGLLVWIDLMYACAYYELTPDFEKSIRLETEQNVRRIRSHASLAVLCGNNEMEWQHVYCIEEAVLKNNDPERRPFLFADYAKLFEYILPEIVKRNAPEVFWWPSSPSSGGSFMNPNDYDRGDTHYWDVWHGEKPFTEYRKFFFRYASEFGFQSFPCLKTIESFTEPGDRNIFSRIMERHQRNLSANGKIMNYLSQTFRYPNSFDNLLYCSQMMQAEAIRYGVEHWRRNRGRCMGAIIWQLNDIWPVASWASIDYFGRWKALHYAAKRFFAPVMISCMESGELDQNPHINEFHRVPVRCAAQLNVTNETMENVTGTVVWTLRTPDGTIVKEGKETITVPALSSKWIEELSIPEAKVTGTYLSFRFEQNGFVISSGSVLFCAPKHFEFKDPQLKVSLNGDEITVTASAYARGICIESDDADLVLDDNFFDMDPGTRKIRIVRGNATEGLKVRSVFDI